MGPDGALAEPHDSEHVSQQTKRLPFSFAPCARPPASAPRSILSLSASAARRQQPGLATRPSTTRTGHGIYAVTVSGVDNVRTNCLHTCHVIVRCLLSVVCCLVSVETPMSTQQCAGHTGGQAPAAAIHFTSDIKKLRLQISSNALHLMATINIVG